ncbi:alpha/beta hydrolase [Marmoricola sp. URHA0025 HA25]
MTDLDHEIAALRDRSREAGLAPLVELSPSEARERVRGGNRLCAAGPTEVAVTDVVAEHGGRGVDVRVYAAADAAATLVYAHGGGWVTGDLDYSDELCRFVAAGGVRVVSVDYRLAPEHRFPAAFDDMLTATCWASATHGRVAVGGDSAGGNLAAATALALRDEPDVRLAFQVLVYPVLDTDVTTDSYASEAEAFPMGAADMRWFLDHYLDGNPREDDRVAPLVAASLAGLPPTHLVVAGHDPLRDEARSFARRLAEAGVPVTAELHPSLCHGFLRFTAASSGARTARDGLVARIVALAEDVAPALG